MAVHFNKPHRINKQYLSEKYQSMRASEKDAMQIYQNERDTFNALSKEKRANIMIKHPNFMMFMMEQKDQFTFLTTPFGSCETYWRGGTPNPLNFSSLLWVVAAFQGNLDLTKKLYRHPVMFKALTEMERTQIALRHPEIAFNFVKDKHTHALSSDALSYFTTCVCINARYTAASTIIRCTYGPDLDETQRNRITFEIAKEPDLLLNLNPAARIILLSRLKKMINLSFLSNEELLSLPDCVKKATETADNFQKPEQVHEPLCYYHFCGKMGFWLPAFAGMTYENSRVLQFSDIIDYCLGHRDYECIVNGKEPLSSDEETVRKALALVIVMDSRHKRGYQSKSDPKYFEAKLNEHDRKAIIEYHHLSKKIEQYNDFTRELTQMLKVEDSQGPSQVKEVKNREKQPLLDASCEEKRNSEAAQRRAEKALRKKQEEAALQKRLEQEAEAMKRAEEEQRNREERRRQAAIQEEARRRMEREAEQRRAEQKAEALRVAEREAEAQRRMEQEAEARRIAEEQRQKENKSSPSGEQVNVSGENNSRNVIDEQLVMGDETRATSENQPLCFSPREPLSSNIILGQVNKSHQPSRKSRCFS